MFTGLIQRTGRFDRLTKRGEGGLLTIAHEPWPDRLAEGESVAVQGACLTVVTAKPGLFTCDVLEETLRRTALGRKRPGAALNLERAMGAADRLGGHIVSGHVDGTGRVAGLVRHSEDWELEIQCEDDLLRDIAPKGSVAVDGVSLTVVALRDLAFTVHVIPYTWLHTSLSSLGESQEVNIETDMLAKYVRRYLERRDAGPARGLSADDLRRAGFA